MFNHSNVISDSLVQNLILKKIDILDSLFKESIQKNDFSVIIDNGIEPINNKHWDWSLGITYLYPEKIVIKAPNYAHISMKKFQQVILHELNHLMINRVDVHRSIPRWFKEGFAMYFADEISLNHKLKISNYLYNEKIFKIELLNSFSNFDRQKFNLAYAQSAIYVLSIEQFFGENTLQEIYRRIYQGKNFETAFYESTLTNINKVDELLYPYIKNKYKWYKLIMVPDKLFSFLPLLLVLGFILRSMKNKKIEKKWKLEEENQNLENSDIN